MNNYALLPLEANVPMKNYALLPLKAIVPMKNYALLPLKANVLMKNYALLPLKANVLMKNYALRVSKKHVPPSSGGDYSAFQQREQGTGRFIQPAHSPVIANAVKQSSVPAWIASLRSQ
jgi:hypothetical protein